MILRNGLHSMTRSKKRTALFLTLIFFLSLILSVSGGIWIYSGSLIKECATAYRCAATVEYIGAADPSGEKEETAVNVIAGLINDTDILSVDGVRSWMRTDLSLGTIDGYVRTTGFAREDCAVLKLGSFVKESGTHWIANVKEVLYAFDCDSSLLINVVTDATGFYPDKNTVYYVNGYFSKDGPQNGFKNFHVAYIEGDSEKPWAQEWEDITRFTDAATDYAAKNNSVTVGRSVDTEALPAFQQGSIHLTEGRFPEKEYECVITEDIAGSLSLSTGDTLRMRQLIALGGSLFNTGGYEEYREYTVCGISSTTPDWRSYMWTMPAAKASPLYGKLIGTVVFENDKAVAACEELQKYIPDGALMTLYDQGYDAAVSPLKEAVSAASFICFIAAGTMLFVLIFFMYIFTGMQEENIRTMVCLGTEDRDITKWLMAGAAPIVVIASSAGAAIGCFLLPLAVKAAKLLSELNDPFPSYYSEVAMGLQKSLPDFGGINPLPIIMMMLVFFVLSMIILYIFVKRLKRAALLERGKAKVKIPKGTTSTAFRGAFRFAWLSARRGGLRSLAVLLLSFVMCISVALTSTYTAEWQNKLEGASTDIVTKGIFVSPSGNILSSSAAQGSAVRHLSGMPETENIIASVRWNYWFPDDMPDFADTSFGQDHRQEWIEGCSFLYALNDIGATQETCFTTPQVSWGEGYGDDILREGEYQNIMAFDIDLADSYDTYPAVITRTLAARKGIEEGEVFYVMISYKYIPHTGRDAYYNNRDVMAETRVYLKAAGILENDGGSEGIFIPLSAYGNYLSNDPSVATSPEVVKNTDLLRQYLYMNTTYSYCGFTIKDGVSPDEFKERLIEEGFSAPGHMLRERSAVMLRDREYVLLRDGAKKFIRTGLRLTGIILALIAVTGYILSYLSVNARRDEIRLMRTLGCKKGRVSRVFLLEQLVLLIPGLICLPAVLLTNEYAGMFTVVCTALYVVMYLIGAGISIKAVRKSALIGYSED